MYDGKIVSVETQSVRIDDRILPLRNMLAAIADCTDTTVGAAAAQGENDPEFRALGERYARAGSIAQRRVDAVVREGGVEIMSGCSLIARRRARTAPGTVAAAHFLQQRMTVILRRIDRLLPAAA